MVLETLSISIMKFSSKYKTWLIVMLILWAIGMILTIFLMGWSSTKVEVQKSYLSYSYGKNKLPPANSFKMIKISKYCNFPNDFTTAQEGQMSGNFSLAMVSVIIRHGDRSPLQPVRNLTSIKCNIAEVKPLFARYLKTMNHLQKKLVRDLPFKQFSLYPAEKCSLSHLTRRGALQHLALGATLAKIYNKRWRLIYNKKTSFNQISVYSTLFSRTYQSSLAFLFGFLPAFDLNRINITAVYGVHFSMSKEYSGCPILHKMQSQLAKKRSALLESHPAVTRLLNYLHPIAVPNFKYSKQSARSLLDSFMFYVCHGTHLPCVKEGEQCATFEQVRNVLAFNEWEGRQRVEDHIYLKYSWLQIYGFLVHIHKKMENLINGKRSSHRFVLYSGHDVTLEPLLTVLGISDGTNPPYASRLIFELYASNEKMQLQAKHVLRIVYNGKDMTKFISFCRDTSSTSYVNGGATSGAPGGGANKKINGDYCPFEKFTQFVRSTFYKVTNSATYKEACDLKLQDDAQRVLEAFL